MTVTLYHHVDDLASTLIKCKNAKDLAKALHIHCMLCEIGLDIHSTLGNEIVFMFVECGCMVHAQQTFKKLPYQSDCSWSSLIAGYVKQDDPNCALSLYNMATDEDSVLSNDAAVALLKACAMLRDLETGAKIHAEISRKQSLESNIYISNTLIHMYAKCGFFIRAEEVLSQLPTQQVVYWNSLIGGYVEHGCNKEALDVLDRMRLKGVSPNAVTLVCSLKACGNYGIFSEGCKIHTELAKKGYLDLNVFVASTLVDMYVRCGFLDNAVEIFKNLQARNVVTWNALMTGYSSRNHGEEAMKAFKQMQHEGVPPDAVTLASFLKACISAGLADKGQEVHIEIVLRGLEGEILVGASLINLYANFGWLIEAQQVFDKLEAKSVVSWTTLIAGYVSCGYDELALQCYYSMCGEKSVPDSLAFVSCLKACAGMGDMEKGQALHAEIIMRGLLNTELFIGSALIDMYAKGGCLEEARSVFEDLMIKDVAVWNSFIGGFADQRHAGEALKGIDNMQLEGILPNATTYMYYLIACILIGETNQGRKGHVEIVKQGLLECELSNMLVDFYAKSALFEDALKLIDSDSASNAIAWNALISGYCEQNCHEKAIYCLDKMQHRSVAFDTTTYVLGLKACGSIGALSKGKDLHADIMLIGLENELMIGNVLVDMYSKLNLLDEAQEAFKKLSTRTLSAWNSLLGGFIDNGYCDIAFKCLDHLYGDSPSLDAITLLSCLKACGSVGATDEGQQLHALATKKGLERELLVGNALIDMYATCGWLMEAKDVLQKLPIQAMASWTALVLGYAGCGQLEEALCTVHQMQLSGFTLDAFNLFCCLTFCGSLGTTNEGREIHSEIVKRGYLEGDNFSGSNLVGMYVNWGFLEDAQKVLTTLATPDTVSSNMLMSGYAEHKMSEQMLHSFEQMQHNCVSWDAVSIIYGLVACGNLGAMAKAQEIHIEAVKRGLEIETFVGISLVDVYAKVGLLANAHEMFEKLHTQDSVSWNVLILGYGLLGDCMHAFLLCKRMEQERVKPDATTFVNILTLCSHNGLVENGKEYFYAINGHFGLTLTQGHFNCFVDLLGRAGQVDTAFEMIEWMPYHPDHLAWHTVLAACRKWSNAELGRSAFEQALGLDHRNSAAYASILNILADSTACEHEASL